MHCLLSDWEVLSFANMLLMWVNMLQSEYLSRTSAGKEKETRVVEEREQNVRKTTHASHVHINMFNAPVSLIVRMQHRPYLCQSFSGPDYSVSSYRDIGGVL